jgi:hypothetical protein
MTCEQLANITHLDFFDGNGIGIWEHGRGDVDAALE